MLLRDVERPDRGFRIITRLNIETSNEIIARNDREKFMITNQFIENIFLFLFKFNFPFFNDCILLIKI